MKITDIEIDDIINIEKTITPNSDTIGSSPIWKFQVSENVPKVEKSMK